MELSSHKGNDDEQRYLNSINLNTNSNFPYLIMDATENGSVPKPPGAGIMHWHKDFQLIYVLEGSIDLRTLSGMKHIQAGEAIFINQNIVHRVYTNTHCHYKSILFPEHLVSFYAGGPAKKYVNMIADSKQLTTCIFSSQVAWQHNLLQVLDKLIALEEAANPTYEYEVLTLLARIWLIFIRNIDIPVETAKTETVKRMKKFLKYIEMNYSEEISLQDLADAAAVSKSECLRCFKQTLQTTPYKYLMEYRLSQAAALLQETDLPIGEIATKVCFHQVSHFGKCFKSKTGYSPKEYRKQFLKNI